MNKYTYNTFKGNYNDFMTAFAKLNYIDTMLVCTDDYIANNSTSVNKLATITDISQYFETDNDKLCFIYSNYTDRLFIMNELLYDQAIYTLADNAYQYYYHTQYEYSVFDTRLYSSIDFTFSSIDNIAISELKRAYLIGSNVDNALTELCFYGKLGGYELSDILLHSSYNDNTQALFEQVIQLLNNVLLHGKLIV